MANMELQFAQRSIHSAVEVEIPALEPYHVSRNPLPVEEICLKFTIQMKCSRFHAAEDGMVTLVWQHDGSKVHLSDHQLPVNIINHGDDTLQHYLSRHFTRFGDTINSKTAADEIIERWAQIRDEVNSSSFGKIFPLAVNLTVFDIVTLYERPSRVRRAQGMVPTSNTAMKEMLKRVKTEAMEDQNCVICLEEFGKQGTNALQMPCLHVFHGECIKKWLKRSRCCPTCRYQMPTN